MIKLVIPFDHSTRFWCGLQVCGCKVARLYSPLDQVSMSMCWLCCNKCMEDRVEIFRVENRYMRIIFPLCLQLKLLYNTCRSLCWFYLWVRLNQCRVCYLGGWTAWWENWCLLSNCQRGFEPILNVCTLMLSQVLIRRAGKDDTLPGGWPVPPNVHSLILTTMGVGIRGSDARLCIWFTRAWISLLDASIAAWCDIAQMCCAKSS